MVRKHEKPDIDITRNPVERFLMYAKGSIRQNRTLFIAGTLFFLISVVLLIASIVIFSRVTDRQRAELENLNEKFQSYLHENKTEDAREVISEIMNLTDFSLLGFVNRMGYYYAGNYYYIIGDYKEAKEALKLFVNRSDKNVFWELAFFRVGVIYQEAGELEKALDVYKEIDRSYEKGVILDQLYYYMANLYAEIKDYYNAEFYYNRVINDFSRSPYADMARQNLFFLGSG